MTTLIISRDMLGRLIREAENSIIEVCSILIGLVQDDSYIVKEYVNTRNTDMSPVSFKADPKDLARAVSKLIEESYDIVGVFHSHPAPPTPSARDIEGMKLWPQTVWIIYSTTTHSLEAYIFRNGKVYRVRLRET
jgi:proteasome lid subunit RPN8/RPN11